MTSALSVLPFKTSSIPFVGEDFFKQFLSKPGELSWQALPSFSNSNYVLNNEIVVRFGAVKEESSQSRVTKEANLRAAFDLGFCPLKILLFDTSSGLMVTRFLEQSKFLSSERLREFEILCIATQLLKGIHVSTLPFANVFSPFGRLKESYSKLELACFISTELKNLVQRVFSLAGEVDTALFFKVPCHNDPSPENFFLVSPSNLLMIDWEFSGLSDPAFDISHLVSILLLDKDSEETVIKTYDSKDVFFRSKVQYFKPIVHLSSVLWAYQQMQEPVSKLPYSVVQQIYAERVEAIERIITSPIYLVALNELRGTG